jgi:hypothetical protein
MPTRKLNRTLTTLLLLLAVTAARPGAANAQTCGASTGQDKQGNQILSTGCDPSGPVSGVSTSRGRGPVCTYRPATNGEVIAIANQQPEPGTDVTAPTIPFDINSRAHQLTIRTSGHQPSHTVNEPARAHATSTQPQPGSTLLAEIVTCADIPPKYPRATSTT